MAGAGRRARAQITMSVGVRIDVVATAAWGWLSLATGLAVIDAVTPLIAAGGIEARLKWPNDVLAGPPQPWASWRASWPRSLNRSQ
ncbi:putative biotin--[acetyl-CoA-carboxylase] ligase [Mycobacterium kansasii]|uniref:Putative biotin--[acetyl-CoA-carboxylase] ligase n=1 Tax=Mycobacterium kansasii TaxID=1768 RepID=A0A1V3WL46_MYCKA|nr:putative biotin--[acetyl-CoA-carboxylase] ligase [Mycobacterium kansasii]